MNTRTKAITLALLGALSLVGCFWFYFGDQRPPAPASEIDLYDVFFRPIMFLTLPFISVGCFHAALRIIVKARH